MAKKEREGDHPQVVTAIPEGAILLVDRTNWIMMSSTRVTVEEWLEWSDADSNGKLNVSITYLVRYVASWSFVGDPADEDAWKKLDLADFFMINKAVSEAFAESIKAKNS